MAAPADQVLIVLLSAFVGYGSKWAQDWWTARNARKREAEALWSLHKQQVHLPLLDAGRQLEARLSELADIYRGKSPRHTPGSLSGDFRELYLLRRDEIPWSRDKDEGPSILDSDGNQPRRDDFAVQRVRKRMCYELTLATSSLYWTAPYLAHARLAHLHLSGGGSSLDTADREGLDQLIADVGAKLQGDGGAGMFSEQQESIAEIMVDSGGKVLSHYDFRRRLLEVPGWEQFTALFLFFISEDNQLDIATLGEREKNRARFVAKLDNEVDTTIEGPARLRTRLGDICGLQAAPLNV
jgi:hypothetical protein